MDKRCSERRTFSREFELEAARQVVTGAKRPTQVWREYEISETLLLRWRRECEERGEEAFKPRRASREEALEARVAELERYCGQLSLELAVAKQALQQGQVVRSRNGTR